MSAHGYQECFEAMRRKLRMAAPIDESEARIAVHRTLLGGNAGVGDYRARAEGVVGGRL